ncbi:MAG: hypothetical protein J6K21_00750 [Bacilli bacterium]|nr:hypothetical protein [Bacilli bacterium]
MKVLLNVTLCELEDKINRQILVDENIFLTDLCEYVIVSMNGKKIPIYELEYGRNIYWPYDIEEIQNEKTLLGLTLRNLNLKKGKSFCIRYNFDNFYYFDLTVDNFIEEDNDNENIDFKVITGNGYGIIDDKMCNYLVALLAEKRKNYDSYYLKSEKEYLQKSFDVNEVNKRIDDYKKSKEDMLLPKKYIFNVSLEGFNKEIKRKILVNSNIIINNFCEKVILSMNGDLSHPFDVKIGKEYLGEYYSELELFYLNLREKNKLKIIYDWGDNWQFNLTLSKIIDGTNEKEFEVLSGKGYGIIDDCGGVYCLYGIFNGEDTDWGDYDINQFNLEKCNEIVQKIG